MHARIAIAGLTAIALALTACGAGSSANDDSIVIGTAQSLTGEYQALGFAYRAGAEYAVQVANDEGGVNGRPITLDVRDDQSKPDQAVIALGTMADSAVAYLGPGGANTAQASVDVAQRYGIPLVSPSGLSVIDDSLDQVFEVSTPSTQTAQAMVDYIASTGVTSVYGVVNTEDGGMQTGWRATEAALEAAGISIAGTSEVGFSTMDNSATLAQLQQASPQFVVAWLGGPPAVAFANQYTAAGIDLPLLQSNAVAAPYYYGSGDGVANTMVATSLPVLGPSLPESAFRSNAVTVADGFQQQNGSAPDMFAFMGYAGVPTIVAALRAADDITPAAVQAALSTLTVDTVLGPIAYSSTDHGGPNADYMAIGVVHDGTLVTEPWSFDRLERLLS